MKTLKIIATMRYAVCALLAFCLCWAVGWGKSTKKQSLESSKAKVESEARTMVSATIKGDFKTILEMTHPAMRKEAIDHLGGEEKWVEMLEKAFEPIRNNEIQMSLKSLGNAEIAEVDGTRFAVVPYQLNMTSKELGAATLSSAIVGVSDGDGKDWGYVNIDASLGGGVREVIPEFPQSLAVPKHEINWISDSNERTVVERKADAGANAYRKVEAQKTDAKIGVKTVRSTSYLAEEKFGEILFKKAHETTNQYNRRGMLLSTETDNKGWVGDTEPYVRYAYDYNSHNQLIAKTKLTRENFIFGKIAYKYDQRGNLTEETFFNREGDADRKITHVYDNNGNLISKNWVDINGKALSTLTYSSQQHQEKLTIKTSSIYKPNGSKSIEEEDFDEQGNLVERRYEPAILHLHSDGTKLGYVKREPITTMPKVVIYERVDTPPMIN